MGISRKEALECFSSNDLVGIGMEADAIRRRLHPDGIVSYVLDGTLYHSTTPQDESLAAIERSTDRIATQGGTTVVLADSNGFAASLEHFEALLTRIRRQNPRLWIHGLSAQTIFSLAASSGLALGDVIARLHAAGLDSVAGDDVGILDDAVQSPDTTLKAADWLAVHRAAHKAGLQSTAAMSFGAGESFEHRMNHLEAIRSLQSETGGFVSFAPRAVIPAAPAAAGFEEATAVEYLKTLAISRIYLDNVLNLQSDLATEGLKVLQVGLRFGSNDAGSVLAATGANAATEEQLRHAIRDAGFRPIQRDTLFRTMYLN